MTSLERGTVAGESRAVHQRPLLTPTRDELRAAGPDRSRLDQLSMGMSHDLEVAVEEGATMVRVGTALFGPRPPAAAALQ